MLVYQRVISTIEVIDKDSNFMEAEADTSDT